MGGKRKGRVRGVMGRGTDGYGKERNKSEGIVKNVSMNYDK